MWKKLALLLYLLEVHWALYGYTGGHNIIQTIDTDIPVSAVVMVTGVEKVPGLTVTAAIVHV